MIALSKAKSNSYTSIGKLNPVCKILIQFSFRLLYVVQYSDLEVL